ncbi:MAG: flavodoxin [Paludibacteraceae bacterium]
MKHVSFLSFIFCFLLAPSSCAADNETESEMEPGRAEENVSSKKTIVVYFSQTEHTKAIAEHISEVVDADTWRIEALVPYTQADIDYGNSSSRTSVEQNDESARPKIKDTRSNLDGYDVVYLGYPIWWGIAPRIILTFLESCDLSGKIVIPFCTSASSGIGTSDTQLHAFAPNATWMPGRRFAVGSSLETVRGWVNSVHPEKSGAYSMNLFVNGHKLTASMSSNSSASALRDLLEKGDLTILMSDYGGFEKVGPLGASLPANDEYITTEPGDIILYQGDKITLYYDVNAWNFTRLGKIDGVEGIDLKPILGDGGVTVVLSLNDNYTMLEDVGMPNPIERVEVFSVDGKLLGSSLERLRDGMNVVKYSMENGQTIIKKIIR